MLEDLYASWGPELLAFLAELPKQTPDFSKYILQLLSKHFNFNKSFIFPFAYQAIDIERRSKREAMNNIVSLNVDAESVKEYVEVISKVDIFSPRFLPESLRRQKVLFTYDVMPERKYYGTEYYKYMKKYDMEKQACIYLRRKNEVIATICLFRSQREADFSAKDRLLMEYLSDVISDQYIIALKLSGDVMSQEGFNMFFRKSDVGAAMLNSHLTVVMANNSAQDYSRGLVDVLGKERELLTRSNYRWNAKYSNIQQIIDWIGMELVNSDAGMTRYSFLLEEYFFLYCPVFFVNIFGDVEIRHLVLFWRVKKEVSYEFKKIYDSLTQRELEILRLVIEGRRNLEIAELLNISKYTVRSHVSNLYQKFDVQSRLELIAKVGRGSLREAPV